MSVPREPTGHSLRTFNYNDLVADSKLGEAIRADSRIHAYSKLSSRSQLRMQMQQQRLSQ